MAVSLKAGHGVPVQASLPIRSLDTPLPSNGHKATADAEEMFGETLDGAAVEGSQQVPANSLYPLSQY